MEEENKVIDVVVEEKRMSNVMSNEPQQRPRGQEEIGIGTCIVVTALQFGAMVGVWGLIGGAILGLLIGLVFCRKKGEQAPYNGTPHQNEPTPPSNTPTPENTSMAENENQQCVGMKTIIVSCAIVFSLLFGGFSAADGVFGEGITGGIIAFTIGAILGGILGPIIVYIL